nr:Biomphalaria glabrata xanthine dehydrogenase/oxidase-like [Biomphalaria glabrata]
MKSSNTVETINYQCAIILKPCQCDISGKPSPYAILFFSILQASITPWSMEQTTCLQLFRVTEHIKELTIQQSSEVMDPPDVMELALIIEDDVCTLILSIGMPNS